MVDSPFIKGYLFTIKKIQMKNYFLFFLLTIIALAYACNESDYDPTEDLETRSSVAYGSSDASTLNTSSCFPELCPTPPPIVTPGPWPTDVPIGLTSNPPTQIVFKSGSLDYTLQATGGYSDSREYTLVTDEAVYVLTDSQSEDLSEIKESTYRVPKCIYKVFDMDYSKMLSGEASVDDFASVYEGQEIANQQENGRIVVNISSIEIDECDPPQYSIRTIDWCEQRLFATTNRWMSNMTSNIGMDDFTTPVVRGVISKAVEECAAETDCYDCIDPRCILDKINQADIGSSIKDQINTNYENLIDDKVKDAYDVDSGTLSTTALDVKEFLISEDCKPTIIGACGDEISGTDFVDILETVGAENVDDLLNELSIDRKYYRILGFPESDENSVPNNDPFYGCADKIQCILNKYLATTFCDNQFKIFDKVQNNGGFGVEIWYDYEGVSEDEEEQVNLGYAYNVNNVDKFKNEYDKNCCFYLGENPDRPDESDRSCCWKPNGLTPHTWGDLSDSNMADTYPMVKGKPGKGIKTVINRYLCTDYGECNPARNGLEIASLIAHELLHARVAALMKENCLNRPPCDPDFMLPYMTGNEENPGPYWSLLLEQYEIDGFVTLHGLMDKVFTDDLIRVLMEMNGDTDEDNEEKYKYLVLENVAPDPPKDAKAEDYESDPKPVDLIGLGIIVAPGDMNGDGETDYEDHLLEYERLQGLSQSLSPSSLDACE